MTMSTTTLFAKCAMYFGIWCTLLCSLVLGNLSMYDVGKLDVRVAGRDMIEAGIVSIAVTIMIAYICERMIFGWRVTLYRTDGKLYMSYREASEAAIKDIRAKIDIQYCNVSENIGFDKKGHWMQMVALNTLAESKRYYYINIEPN